MPRRSQLSADIIERLEKRIPPNNVEAERAVLGIVLARNEYLSEMITTLNAEDFYYADNRLIFHVLIDLYRQSKPVDLITVANELELRGQLTEVGGYEYLTNLPEAAPLLGNFRHYAGIVRDKSRLRTTIRSLNEVLAHCYGDSDNVDELLDIASKRLFEVRQSEGYSSFAKIGDVLAERINYIDQHKNGVEDESIKSGFESLDRTLGGLRKGALLIIAARPGMGKTALALNIAHKAATIYGEGTAIFSLEMSKEELATRFLASHMSIDSTKLSNCEVSEAEWDKIVKNFDTIYPAPIYIDDRSGVSPVEMLAKCRQLKLEGKLKLVIVDYLQLMSGDNNGRDSRQQEISDISRQLKIMARELDVPVIALSQLSRSCESRTDKRPVLSDLRDSGAIEQDADVVMFVFRPAVYEKREVPGTTEQAELIIAKNRHGATCSLPVGWIPRFTTFYELDYEHQLEAQGDIGLPEPPPF